MSPTNRYYEKYILRDNITLAECRYERELAKLIYGVDTDALVRIKYGLHKGKMGRVLYRTYAAQLLTIQILEFAEPTVIIRVYMNNCQFL